MTSTLAGILIKPKILFVDDNLNFIKSVLSFLKLNESLQFGGFASCAEEAIQMIRSDNPDIVIMDIQMPGIGGIEATRIIKKMNPAIKIIIMSLHQEEQYRETARSAGADAFIIKSRFVDDFHTVINSILLTGISQ